MRYVEHQPVTRAARNRGERSAFGEAVKADMIWKRPILLPSQRILWWMMKLKDADYTDIVLWAVMFTWFPASYTSYCL